MYENCCVPFLHGRIPVKTLFSNPLQKKKNAQVVNLNNPDLDVIILENPPREWIFWIHNLFLDFTKTTQNHFLDPEIWIWIFPKIAPLVSSVKKKQIFSPTERPPN